MVERRLQVGQHAIGGGAPPPHGIRILAVERGEVRFAMSAAWLGVQGSISREVIWLFAIALPVLFAGTWLGLKLYGRLDEAQFRRVVVILLLASGAVLLFR
jgi:hypothetical protein